MTMASPEAMANGARHAARMCRVAMAGMTDKYGALRAAADALEGIARELNVGLQPVHRSHSEGGWRPITEEQAREIASAIIEEAESGTSDDIRTIITRELMAVATLRDDE